jgi:hypothetical protein
MSATPQTISMTNLSRALGFTMPGFTRFVAANPTFPQRVTRIYYKISQVREWIIAQPRQANLRVEDFDARVAEIFRRKRGVAE